MSAEREEEIKLHTYLYPRSAMRRRRSTRVYRPQTILFCIAVTLPDRACLIKEQNARSNHRDKEQSQ